VKSRQAVFKTREARTTYLAEHYRPYLKGRILDVGCDQAVLKELIQDIDYFGIDVGGTPDLILDLETIQRLPFADDHFHCVVCSDVLEHLDNLHAMFVELVRVARSHLIISMPNCWNAARRPLSRGRGHFLHYGLPVQRPGDRHKWFFSTSEAEAFLRSQAQHIGLDIVDLHTTEKPRSSLIRNLRRLRYPNQARYLNRYAHTLWALLQKKA